MVPPAPRRRMPAHRVRPRVIAFAAIALGIAGIPGFAGLDRVPALMTLSVVLTSAGVGAALVERRPGNRVGSLLLIVGVLLGAVVAFAGYADAGAQVEPDAGSVAAVSGLVATILFDVSIVVALIGMPLLFPDGHLISRRWWVVVWLATFAMATDVVSTILRPGPVPVGGLENPLAVHGADAVLGPLSALSIAAAGVAFGAAIAAVVIRFRSGRPIERQQLKWFGVVAGFGASVTTVSLVIPLQPLADILTSLGILALAAVPLAIGVAVLRYRLYEIDRIISRTIAWTITSGAIVALFGGLVIGLQALLAPLTAENTVAVAASTLVAFAVFQPLRSRVQRAVDRRFHRARYDGERLVEAFAEGLRDEVDLPTIEHHVLATADAAFAPVSAGLWLRRGGAR